MNAARQLEPEPLRCPRCPEAGGFCKCACGSPAQHMQTPAHLTVSGVAEAFTFGQCRRCGEAALARRARESDQGRGWERHIQRQNRPQKAAPADPTRGRRPFNEGGDE